MTSLQGFGLRIVCLINRTNLTAIRFPTDYHACTVSKQQQTTQPGLQALSPAQFLKEGVLPRQISLNVNVYYLYFIILLASAIASSNQV